MPFLLMISLTLNLQELYADTTNGDSTFTLYTPIFTEMDEQSGSEIVETSIQEINLSGGKIASYNVCSVSQFTLLNFCFLFQIHLFQCDILRSIQATKPTVDLETLARYEEYNNVLGVENEPITYSHQIGCVNASE